MNSIIILSCIFSIIESVLVVLIALLLGTSAYLKIKKKKYYKKGDLKRCQF